MKQTKIIGVLNITPDSFSDGGMYFENPEKAVMRALEMVEHGADIIDIGGESTRPGSLGTSAQEEIERVLPVIELLRTQAGNKVQISIDTNKAEVARYAVKSGATIINSLGGLNSDKELASVVSESGAQLIIYHIKGTPETMQKDEITYTDVIQEIIAFFDEQLALGTKHGLKREQFILDPGIGFGKTVEQNLEIIRRLNEFTRLELPILIGVSRKSHLGALLQSKLALPEVPPPTERLEASLAETAVAIRNGATYVRTHDVLQTKKFITVLEELR